MLVCVGVDDVVNHDTSFHVIQLYIPVCTYWYNTYSVCSTCIYYSDDKINTFSYTVDKINETYNVRTLGLETFAVVTVYYSKTCAYTTNVNIPFN